MSRCAECGFDWESPPEDVIPEIERWASSYRAALTRFLAGDDQSQIVRSRPAPDVWSALEYTAHMRDVIDFYRDRIDRVLREDRPAMDAADFSSMAESRNYRDEGVEAVLESLVGGAADVAARLRSLAPEEWDRVGIGSEGDERTVLVLSRRLAHDGHHHLLDIGRGLRQLRQLPTNRDG